MKGFYILAEHGANMAAVSNNVPVLVELPPTGLIWDRPVEDVASAVAGLARAWRQLGRKLDHPL